MAFTDDFNRADSPDVGNGWEERSNIYQILGNKVRTSGGGTNWRNSCVRPSSEAWENGTVEVEFTVVTAFETYPRVEARWNLISGVPRYYDAYTTSSLLTIGRYYSGTHSSLGNVSISPGLSVGQKYTLTLTLSGSSITAELRNADTSQLIVSKNVTDATIAGAGQQAFAVSAAASQPTDFDNFSSSPYLDAAQAVADDGLGADAVAVTDAGNTKTPADGAAGSDGLSISVTTSAADAGQGQDAISIAVFIGLDDSGGGAEVPSIVQPPMLSLLERFDGTLEAWTLDTTGGTAQIQTVSNDEKLVLSDTSAGASVSATRTIEGQSAPFCAEADVYTGAGGVGLFEVLDSADNVLFSARLDANTLVGTFGTDSDAPSTFAINATQYYNIIFYCDTASDTVKAWYLTGEGATPSECVQIGAAKSYSGGLASKVRLSTDPASIGEARFDEIKVYRPSVFCIGDSNTGGYSNGVDGRWNPSPQSSLRVSLSENEAHSYPHLLGLRYAPALWCPNRGFNSQQSSHVDARIQGDVIDQGARTVVILIGTNDITANVLLETIEANISSAAGKAAAAGLAVCLCSVPPHNGWNSTQNTKRSDLNAWIQTHCAANGYRFADVYASLKNPSNPDQLNPAYDDGSGVHLLNAGLQAIADTVYAALLETKSLIDTASGLDYVGLSVVVSLAEACLGTEEPNVLGRVSVGETASGMDAFAIAATVQLLEAASAIEGLVAGGLPVGRQIADSGSGADSVSAVIRAGATLQDIYDLTLTRLSALEYSPPDNAAISSIHALVAGIEKWKNNKLARTGVSGAVETWVLFDDDGTTPLLTWTRNTVTRTRGKATP